MPKAKKTCCEEQQKWFTHPCNEIDTGTRDYGVATATCRTCGKNLQKKSFVNPRTPTKLYIAEKDTYDYRCGTCGGPLEEATVRHDILVNADINPQQKCPCHHEFVMYCPACEPTPEKNGSALIKTSHRTC